MKYTLPTNAEELTKLVNTAITSATTMRNKVQIASVAILHHAYKCGDWTAANTLVEGLGHGVKRDSLVEYFVVNGGLTIAEGAKEFTGWSGKDFIKENFENAKEKMWFDYKKSTPFSGYTAQKEFDKLIKKLEAMKKLANEDAEMAEKIDLNISEFALQKLMGMLKVEDLIETEQPANDGDAIAALESIVAADQAKAS